MGWYGSDKAGGYGMQSLGACLVQAMRGCYFNIVGFPAFRFCEQLAALIESGRL